MPHFSCVRHGLKASLLTVFLLAGCSSSTTINQNRTNVGQVNTNVGLAAHPAAIADKRSNEEIARLLPASVFEQKEFPKPYVMAMLRSCINKNSTKNDNNPISQSGRADQFCSCLTENRVHDFKFSELIQAENANFNVKEFPEAAHKNNALLAECAQSVLK